MKSFDASIMKIDWTGEIRGRTLSSTRGYIASEIWKSGLREQSLGDLSTRPFLTR